VNLNSSLPVIIETTIPGNILEDNSPNKSTHHPLVSAEMQKEQRALSAALYGLAKQVDGTSKRAENSR
jgi:hypothetical protein